MTDAAPLRLAVFDLDGTLVDSRVSIHASCSEAFAAIGRPEPTYDEVRQIVGLSLMEGLAILAPDLSDAEVKGLTEHYKSAFNSRMARPRGKDPLYQGADTILDLLKAGGWRISMATGKSRRGVAHALGAYNWAEVFDSTHCADDGPGKPHPAMLLDALNASGARPDQAVMIGDTAHDILMAKAAGVMSVAVTWGFHTHEELIAAEADVICHSFAELHGVLAAFGPPKP